MSYFTAEMHQIRFRLGIRPRPPLGELTALPQAPYLDLRGLLLRERRGWEGKGEGKGRKGGQGGEGNG